ELKIRLLLVSDEGFKDRDLYKTIENAKLELRDRMFFDTDLAPVVMHGSNSREEFIHLKEILLSVNNLRHLKRRIARNYSEEFVERLERLKSILREKHISQHGICISGSSGWEIFGLRKADDTDFIVDDCYREQYGNTTQSWAGDIEYVRCNSIQISDEIIYEDKLLIHDDNYCYVFNGLKFVNLDLIAKKKAYNRRGKDIRDVRLYELFCDFGRNFDDKEALKKQIEKEFYKKR
ncbi:MAG TPA: hypothetical protein DF613_01590, partial [Lachnospiraceae bacterium]|nr:hypothetical protein [Lachnospiraceae bacterium]